MSISVELLLKETIYISSSPDSYIALSLLSLGNRHFSSTKQRSHFSYLTSLHNRQLVLLRLTIRNAPSTTQTTMRPLLPILIFALSTSALPLIKPSNALTTLLAHVKRQPPAGNPNFDMPPLNDAEMAAAEEAWGLNVDLGLGGFDALPVIEGIGMAAAAAKKA